MENVTVVSALYYIGRDKWKESGFGLGNDRYKDWVKNILSLDTNLILFTDDFYYDQIIEVKKQYDSELKSLHIVKSSIDEMESYKQYYVQISCLMQSPEFVNQVRGTTAAEMRYPLYNVLMFNKVNFLKQAKELNPYNSTHFFWADAGAFRNSLLEYENVKWPSNKSYFTDKIVFFSHAGDQYNIGDQKSYFMSQSRVVQGGYFIVPVDKVEFLREEFNKIVDEILEADYIGSDEKVFDLLCKRNIDQVRMVKAGWFEFYRMTMSKVKLYITFYSKPEFIRLQYEQLKKHCKDTFEYIVINNAKDEENERLMKEFAEENHIEVIAVEKDRSCANSSHFAALNSAFNQKAKHDQNFEAVVVMDSDIFAYKDFSFLDILDNNLAAAVYQQRQNTEIEYLWPGFTILSNKANISDIDFSWKTYTDTGGMTDTWLKKYNITPKWVKHTAAIDIETDHIFTNPSVEFPYKREYRSQFIEDTFFHYYRGCNWDEQRPEYHDSKYSFLQYFLENVDKYNLNLDDKVHYDKAHAEKGWEGVDFNYHGYRFVAKEKPSDTMHVVVARYNENINWLNNLSKTTTYTIYNKGEDDLPFPSIKVPNEGREGDTYLRYIIENYDSLPQTIVFCQGGAQVHYCHSCFEYYLNLYNKDILEPKWRGEIFPLGQVNLEKIEADGTIHGMPVRELLSELFPGKHYELLEWSGGAQFIIDKKYILNKSLDWWKNLYRLYQKYEHAPWMFERIWLLIWTHAE